MNNIEIDKADKRRLVKELKCKIFKQNYNKKIYKSKAFAQKIIQ